MVLRGISPFDSGSFHKHTMSARPQTHISQLVDNNDRCSFYETCVASPPTGTHVPAPATTELAFSAWLEPPSLTGSDHVPTPPSFIENSPMSTFPMTDQQLLSTPHCLPRYTDFLVERELEWSQYLSMEFVSQPPPAMTPFSAYGLASYGIASVNTIRYHAEPFTNKIAPPSIQPTPETRTVRCSNPSYMPSYTESSTTSNTSDRDDSESEHDSSSYSRRKCPPSSSGSSRETSHKVPVLKLGKWDMVRDLISQPQPRHYVCGRIKNNKPNKRLCGQKFIHPGHLRRHIKTVHGESRHYFCKLPTCQKAFSRGDNLKVHYLTHLKRKGHTGRNRRMSLDKLKTELGPKEEELFRWLERKLSVYKAKCRLHDHPEKSR
ncbi:hypothetical protein HBH98_254750 [Parastagonospora nodorum]|nr:hypothetical protein HBH53_262450 [Parastagonospora nodorum]KAH3956061.1 hypothetical protein HBH51_256840 [Parastagonospora nodorum]KAH4215308.1 hypothetical protein HBI06_257160 [Parastagonospora nodorum]KAH4222089.1 hypothetical protein HBI05_255360 [Parastagonospora nodorum]KAH4332101.1 hypothetical protein HBH98_254750 [Parastagonospora nodorum]